MRKTNKLLSIILALIMVISMIPITTLTAFAEESYCLNIINHPDSTFELEHDFTSGVYDLWSEIDSEGTGELAFSQSFSVDIKDAIDVYNNYLDTEYNGERDHYKASVDINNGSIFYVQARVLINNYNFQFSSKASYMYAPYGLDGEYNEGCGEWNISSYYDDLSDFFTMTIDGDILNLSLDGTIKEIYEALKAQDETLGDVTINNLEFELRISCEVEYKGSWGSTNYTELSFEALSHSLYDKHIYESASEYDTLSVIPITVPLTANVVPAYEGCYEPVKTEYNWYYEFVKEGYDTDEDDTWYGYFERDESKESDVLTETAPSGTVFGVAYGTVDSGDNNSIMLSDILNEKNKDFINSFIGVKSMEFGGMGQMFIGCTVTLTFADGKQYVVDITKADYSSMLIVPCMHACTVCGLCTVTDEMLPCNFDQMSYDISNVCICDEPSVPEYEITVESEKQMTIESTGRIVNVVVEQVEVEETPPNSFIINTMEAVGADNVMAFYNIDVFDEAGYPYTLNQWYDEGEELTVSVPVSLEEALALQSGEASLYHILANGTAEEVEGVTVEIDGESATMIFTSNSFSPYIVARKASTYTVTYDANGGSGTMATEKLSVNDSGFATTYTFPECEFTSPDGKEFDKWQWYYNSNPEQVNDITPGQSPWLSGDITVKAIWKDIPVVTYTVTYDANGGSGSMASEILTVNDSGFATSYIFPECEFTSPDGKEFDKWQWYYNSNPEQVNDITPGQSPWLSGDITVKAIWKDIPNEITSITATISGIESGATVGSATVTTLDTTYTVTINGWYDCDNVFDYASAPVLQDSDKFEGGKTYTVGVTFTPTEGNIISDVPTASINGETGKIGSWDFGSRTYFITITVPQTINYGDANGDGKITGKDYSLIVQHINGWDVEIIEANADVNGDSKINGKDYALIVRHINGWDVTFGPEG
ncbi:MAG: dockerin type I repeat-containing protein [Clostridia bacterium]|nr:dockerin type I repeat-containing protein [Clostridia bacterium]